MRVKLCWREPRAASKQPAPSDAEEQARSGQHQHFVATLVTLRCVASCSQPQTRSSLLCSAAMYRAATMLHQQRVLTRAASVIASSSAPFRSLCCVARPLLRAAQEPPPPAPPAAAATPPATSSTGFGPKRVIASRVPVSKRAQRAAEAAAAAAAAAAPAAAAAKPVAPASPPSSALPDDDVDASFLAPPPPPPPAPAPVVAVAAAKLSPEQVAAQFPFSRNLSQHQPPPFSSTNPFVHDRWFLTPAQAATPPPPPSASSSLSGSSPAAAAAAATLPECYITQASHLPELVKYLDRTSVVALDTEFTSQHRYRPRLELIQVATPEVLAAVDVSLLRSSPEFRDFLRTLMTKEWIVHAHRGDLEVMHDLCLSVDLPSRTPRALFDTQVAYAFLAPVPSLGYAAMLEGLLGLQIDKSATLTDWSIRPLDARQIEYAIGDVKHLFRCRDILQQKLRASTDTTSALKSVSATTTDAATAPPAAASSGVVGVRESWFLEEMSLLLNPLLYAAPDPALAYTALYNARKFEAGSLGWSIFKSLASWRESVGARLDQVPNYIVTNDMMQAMASTPPRNLEQLSRVVGMKRYTVTQWGEQILAIVNSNLKAAAETGATTTTTEATTPGAAAAVASATAAGSVSPSLSHKDANRLKWDLYSLMSALIDSRSRALQISPFILSPRRDMIDLASLTLPSIQTASKWDQHVGVQGAPSPSAAETQEAPQGFLPSLLPSAVNYRFAGVTEDMVFDRLVAAGEGEGEEEGGDSAAELDGTDRESNVPAALATPIAPVAGERVPLSRAEELTLLARSKLLRGWRRDLIGDDVLKVIHGQPLMWSWADKTGADGKGETKFAANLQ